MIDKHGEKSVAELIIAYLFFSRIKRGITEAKEKKNIFMKATKTLEKIEKYLNEDIPFSSEGKNTRKTILGIAGTYDHFQNQYNKADSIIASFGKDHDGPKKLYLVLLSKIFKTDSGDVDLSKIRELLIFQADKELEGLKESFGDIFNTDKNNEIIYQKDRLRKLIKRSESTDWYKNLLN